MEFSMAHSLRRSVQRVRLTLIDITNPFYYDRTESRFLRKRSLVFIHTPDDSRAQEHAMDLLDAQAAAQPFVCQIADALKSEWSPWMWVTRATILDAMEERDLVRRKGTRSSSYGADVTRDRDC